MSPFWVTVTGNGSPYATEPLSCLSVTLVYCGQTVGWIKMPLGTEVGHGPGRHCVTLGPSSRHGKGHNSPNFSAHVYYVLWPNGRLSQQLLSYCH